MATYGGVKTFCEANLILKRLRRRSISTFSSRSLPLFCSLMFFTLPKNVSSCRLQRNLASLKMSKSAAGAASDNAASCSIGFREVFAFSIIRIDSSSFRDLILSANADPARSLACSREIQFIFVRSSLLADSGRAIVVFESNLARLSEV